MKKCLYLYIALLTTVRVGGAYATYGAQITLENRTKVTLDLYVDNKYACRAPGGGMFNCTAQINAGTFNLEAKDGQKTVAHKNGFVVKEGSSPTWTVDKLDSNQHHEEPK